MKLWGREIAVSRLPRVAGQWLLGSARALRLFRRPWQVLWGYLRRRSPAAGYLTFRDGRRLWLSSCPADIVTAFVVFCKQEYGTDLAGKTVLDIGGNIGCLAVWAGRQGCRQVVSVEPSREAFEVLLANFREHGLGERGVAVRAAVGAAGQERLLFPVSSSPLHRPGQATECELEEVPVRTLGSLLDEHFPAGLDLLKLDCEGAEHELVMQSSAQELARIGEIRMEVHGPQASHLVERLRSAGFSPVFYERLGPETHTLWMRQGFRPGAR